MEIFENIPKSGFLWVKPVGLLEGKMCEIPIAYIGVDYIRTLWATSGQQLPRYSMHKKQHKVKVNKK